jgi:hypothetical protein
VRQASWPVGRILRIAVHPFLLPFENSLDVPQSVQNANDAQGVRLHKVKIRMLFESFYNP